MSADNGVYIAKFPDGYRVAYSHNIEDVDYFPVGSQERKNVLKEKFGKSTIFATKSEAFDEAKRIEADLENDDDFYILEYGICSIGEYESF